MAILQRVLLVEEWQRRCRGDDFLSRFAAPTGTEKVVDVVVERFSSKGVSPPEPIIHGAVAGFVADDYSSIGEARFLQIAHLIESAAELSGEVSPALPLVRIAGQATVQLLVQTWRGSAEEDSLTGLGNRRKMEAELQERRSGGSAFAYVSIDADGLKAVNDAGGHPAGDELLRRIARAIDTVARTGQGRAYRYAGDEFGMICDAPRLEADADPIRDALIAAQAAFPTGTGFSWGLALWPDGDADVEGVVGKADAAMYEQKASRKAASGQSVR
ncbi:MAG: GGDEF domain-containing protein [Microbacterium sp.]|nr:GGDEF domain-containing protein [Microbacterium sp.]